MQVAVSNSGPLIHLAKVRLSDFLFKLFDKIFIPERVFSEVVMNGKEQGYADALVIEKHITDNKIIVKKVDTVKKELLISELHLGELQAIQLALNLDIKPILLDDEEARIFARNLNLKVKGTLGILIDLVKQGDLELESALDHLRELNSIMYLSSDVFAHTEDELKKLER